MKRLLQWALVFLTTTGIAQAQCDTTASTRVSVFAVPSVAMPGAVVSIMPTDAALNFSSDVPSRYYVEFAGSPIIPTEVSRTKVTIRIPENATPGVAAFRICIRDGKWAAGTMTIQEAEDHADSTVNGEDPDPKTQNKKLDLSDKVLRLRPGVTVDNPSGGHNNVPDIRCDSLHLIDGRFTKNRPLDRNEWSGIVPLKGRFSYLYLDYCSDRSILYLMNDWVLGSGSYDSSSCYNLFQFSTGSGRENWEIRVYHSRARGIKVSLNGRDVSKDTSLVLGGAFSFGSSPNDTVNHTMYEFGIKVSEGLFYMPAQTDPVSPPRGGATVTTVCTEEGYGLVTEPKVYVANLEKKGVTVRQYDRYIPKGGLEGLETEPNVIVGEISGNTIRYDIAGKDSPPAQTCVEAKTIDGNIGSNEWYGYVPARGRYTDLYAAFCNGILYVANDWVLADELPNEGRCYNLFELYTGDGAEQWGVYVYHDPKKSIRVVRNGVDVSNDSMTVFGGKFGWGSSPRLSKPHSVYEFGVKAKEGRWALMLADPGPRSFCAYQTSDVPGTTTDSQSGEMRILPNPAQDEIVIHVPPSLPLQVSFRIVSQIGTVTEIPAVEMSKGVYLLDTRLLPQGVHCIETGSGAVLRSSFVLIR